MPKFIPKPNFGYRIDNYQIYLHRKHGAQTVINCYSSEKGKLGEIRFYERGYILAKDRIDSEKGIIVHHPMERFNDVINVLRSRVYKLWINYPVVMCESPSKKTNSVTTTWLEFNIQYLSHFPYFLL